MYTLIERIVDRLISRLAWIALPILSFVLFDPATAQGIAQAAVTPSIVNVGDIQIPYGQAFRSVTLTNTGTTGLTVAIAYPGGQRYTSLGCGDDPSNFHVITVLGPGEACINELIISQSSVNPAGTLGPGSAMVFYELNGGQLRLPVTVQWNAVPPYLNVDITDQDLGQQQVGTVSPAFARNVENNTSQPLDITTELLVGSGPDCSGRVASAACLREIDEQTRSFYISSNGCHPIAPNGSCNVLVQFAPTAAYAMEGAIRVTAPSNPSTIPLEWEIFGTGLPVQTNPNTVLAVEYYDSQLDHYFITAAPLEISLLDSGKFIGWARTGRSFWVFPSEGVPPAGASPVCRFYGRPEAGLDSHFYSASPSECAEVAARFAASWILEGMDVFRVYLPDQNSGACPAGTTPVYRLYDNRADADHRYTIDTEIRDNMIAANWIPEGYGPLGVVMCAPM